MPGNATVPSGFLAAPADGSLGVVYGRTSVGDEIEMPLSDGISVMVIPLDRSGSMREEFPTPGHVEPPRRHKGIATEFSSVVSSGVIWFGTPSCAWT